MRSLNEEVRNRLRDSGALGDDVSVRSERGERMFATSDRVMFLRNERDLGVKNGSLGTVQSVDRMRMAVMLDDGRSVAFDLKDYAHVDHGYAATIHKAQGMTVDRVQVLVTPGVDRHSTYVALSRHREQVNLYYGRDDFANQNKLVRTLSRERGKDMASDYREAATAPTATPKHSIFDGLKLTRPVALDGRVNAPPTELRQPTFSNIRIDARALDPTPTRPPIDKAVERFARAAGKLMEVNRAHREPLMHEQKAYQDAVRELNGLRPGAAADLRAALLADERLAAEASKGRTTDAIKAMERQRSARVEIGQRADAFVEHWSREADRYRKLRQGADIGASNKARTGLAEMAKSLQRDPQLESLLRARRAELGLKPSATGSLSHDLQQWLGRSRDRGLSL